MSKTYTFKYQELNRLRTLIHDIIEEERKATIEEQYLKLLSADPDDQLDIIQKMIDLNQKFDNAEENLTDLLRMREIEDSHKESYKKLLGGI